MLTRDRIPEILTRVARDGWRSHPRRVRTPGSRPPQKRTCGRISLEKDCERTTLIVRSACAGSRRSGSRLTSAVRCASAFARLVFPQVGEAEKEPHRHLAGGALEDVDRLVEGTELVAGDPGPHDRGQPLGITGE